MIETNYKLKKIFDKINDNEEELFLCNEDMNLIIMGVIKLESYYTDIIGKNGYYVAPQEISAKDEEVILDRLKKLEVLLNRIMKYVE